MPNYVSLTESQRRKIAVFITESQQLQQQQQQQQQQQLQANNDKDDSVISSSTLAASPGGSTTTPISGNNSISCKEIVQFCKTRFGLTISLSTASRLRSTATERLSTELLNPSAKRHRSVKFPEFEKALVQELKALEQEQLQIQQEQNAGADNSVINPFGDPSVPLPPVMTLTSEASITQVAKGIAERMGIPETELGLTSGWYHGFKRRHGIKHRQFKPRGANSNGNAAAGSLGAPSLGSISAANSALGGPTSMMDTGDGSDVDGDEYMDDISDAPEASRSKLMSSTEGVSRVVGGVSFEAGSRPGMDSSSRQFMDMRTLAPGERPQGDGGNNAAEALSYLKDPMSMPGMILTPKESSPSSLSRRPEVKRVNAAAANDALDIISEYLLQNGQIGATKLPLVKELRSFFLMQSEIENKAAASAIAAVNNMNSNINSNSGNMNNNSNGNSNGSSNGNSNGSNNGSNNGNNGLLIGVGVPTLAPGSGNHATSVFVHNTTTLPTHAKSGLSAPNVLSFSASNPMSGSAIVPMLENTQSSLNLPADGLRAMEEVLNSHQAQQHAHQQQ